VFAPRVPDGELGRAAANPADATGNLRRRGHLGSLLLWSVVAVVWLGEAR
jgi:hypothetical protein